MLIDPAVEFHDSAQRECMAKAEEVVDYIHSMGLVPVKTGKLLAGYRAEEWETGAAVVTDVDYWYYVEYGHGPEGHREAQPHVRPAIEAMRNG